MPKKDRLTGNTARINSIFVDSSAWIALFSRRDQNHEGADRIFRAFVASDHRLITTNLVLAEIHRLLLHRAGVRAAMTALEKIEASPLVQMEFADASHHRAAKEWLRRLSGHTISYTDAVSFAVMEAKGCSKAISYDDHFREAGFDLRH